MAEELQYNKRKFEDPTSGRRPTGFSAPIAPPSSDDQAPPAAAAAAVDGIELAKQRAQEIAARIFSNAESKRPKFENGGGGGDDSADRGFSSAPPDYSQKSSAQALPSQGGSTFQSSFPSYGYQGSSKRIDIPNGRVGVIIGKGGETIRYLQLQSGAKIQVTRDAEADFNSQTRPVDLVGTPEQISKAEQMISDVLAEAEVGGSGIVGARKASAPQGGSEQFTMRVPNNKVGLIIGKGGETIKSMQAKSGARIQLIPLHSPPDYALPDRVVQIDGTTEQIELAKQLVNEVTSEIEAVLVSKITSGKINANMSKIEAVLVSKIMSGKINANMSKKIACSLALLPKVRGDGDSWFSMMQKILIALNMLISDAFQGLEEENKRSEVLRLLVQPGKDPPPPLGGQLKLGESSELGTRRLQNIVAPGVSALMHACCEMFTNPYPVQVIVPVRPLLAIIARVLTVDVPLVPFITALQQEALCSVLPALHVDSLELLIAIIKGLRIQLLGNVATVIRLLTDYFRRAALPSLRVKIYYIMQILLDSMGVGVAIYLAQEVINNAFIDLSDFVGSDAKTFNTRSPKLVNGALVQDNQRKRKHAFGSSLELSSRIGVEVEAGNGKPVTSVSVKIAALRALESLLTVAGSLKSECWRSGVDLLLLNVARSACDAGWVYLVKCTMLTGEHTSSRAEFQLAAFKALLASLLSSAHVRPPYLSEGLELLHRGKLESGTELAGFCAHALLTLHVLIHPRALPLAKFPDTRLTEKSGGKMPVFSTSNIGIEYVDDVDDDEFCNSLQGDYEETDDDVNNQRMDIAVDDSPEENHPQMNSAEFHEITEGNQSSFTVVAEMQSLDQEVNNAQLSKNPGDQHGSDSDLDSLPDFVDTAPDSN